MGSALILRDRGYDAVHTEELGKEREKDVDLIALAATEGRYIVTRDRHFHMHIANQGLLRPSTIYIRLDQFDEELIAEIVDKLCIRYRSELEAGCLLTYKLKSVRLRKLPVHRALPIRRS